MFKSVFPRISCPYTGKYMSKNPYSDIFYALQVYIVLQFTTLLRQYKLFCFVVFEKDDIVKGM